jgi:hypothetical protein
MPRHPREAACFARIVEIIHFFDSCTKLTRDERRRSCTFGQMWYRTSTYWPKCFGGCWLGTTRSKNTGCSAEWTYAGSELLVRNA